MEQHHSAAKLTYADYLRFPDDGLRHEIIDGEHYVTASPNTRHQRISRNLLYLLHSYLENHPIGEVFAAPFDALLSEFDIVVPDLLYLSNERAGRLTSENLQGSPDLVIEILSPGTGSRFRRDGDRFGEPVAVPRGGTISTPLVPGFELPTDRVLG